MNKGLSKSLQKANQAIARFYVLHLLHLYSAQLRIPFSVSIHNVNRSTRCSDNQCTVGVNLLIIYVQ